MKTKWLKKPKVPGFYWARGEIRSRVAMAHVGERIVWDEQKEKNVSRGWWVQLLPGGVSLPLSKLPSYEFSGPLDPPQD